MTTSLSRAKPYSSTASINLDPDPDPPLSKLTASPAKSSSSSGFLWSNLFADVDSSSFPSSSPTYLSDGTPVVLAPQSVILKASSNWSNHLLCRFLGEPPSPAKFFSDLNRVWGKHGDISVRRFSSGTFLVYVPSSSTRKWILETGIWSSGTVSFVVSEWSVNSSLATPPKLTSATTVLTIRDIPPQLWSQEAVVRIAGGVAKLILGTKASLPLSSLGTATIRAIVPLGSPLPPSVLVKDSYGASVLVSIEYGRLPHLCSNCNSYGHQVHRCPLQHSVGKPNSPVINSQPEINAEPAPNTTQVPIPVSDKETMNLDRDSLPSNAPLVQTDTQESETSLQAMELDSKLSDNTPPSSALIHTTDVPEVTDQSIETGSKKFDELVSVGISSSSPIPASSSPSLNVLQEIAPSSAQVCPVNDRDSPPSNAPLIQTDTHESETSLQAMELDCKLSDNTLPSSVLIHTTDVSEVTDLSIESGNKEYDELVSVGISSSSQIPASSSPSPNVLQEIAPSSAQVCPVMIQEPSSTCLPVPNSSVSLDTDHHISNDGTGHSSPHAAVPNDSITTFSFPPLKAHGLMQDHVHLTSSSSPEVLPKTDHTRKVRRNKDKETEDCDHSLDQKVVKAYMKCKVANNKFKPKGVLEKRRKKMQQELYPEAEELEQGVQELKSDKKDTTYYEALRAIKILQNLDNGTYEAVGK